MSLGVVVFVVALVGYAVYGRACDHFGITIVNASGRDLGDVRLRFRDEEVWRGAIPAGESRSPAIVGRQEGYFELRVEPGGRSAWIGYALPLDGYRRRLTIWQDDIAVEEWRGFSEDPGFLSPLQRSEDTFLLLTDRLACMDDPAEEGGY